MLAVFNMINGAKIVNMQNACGTYKSINENSYL